MKFYKAIKKKVQLDWTVYLPKVYHCMKFVHNDKEANKFKNQTDILCAFQRGKSHWEKLDLLKHDLGAW